MAIANAFAQVRSAQPNPPTPTPLPRMDVDISSERSSKRIKLSPGTEQEIFSRRADPETALEVDHMILDYLAYQCIKACLRSRQVSVKGFGNFETAMDHISLFDDFLVIFKSRHPTFRQDQELRFRTKLLRLVVLFTQRTARYATTPDRQILSEQRKRDSARAREWIGTAERIPTADWTTSLFDSDLPVPNATLEHNRARVLHELGQPAEDEHYEDAFYGTSECVALLNILPLFMEVSAAIITITDSNANRQWMRLAVQFMLQACLEQYLVFGASGTDAVDEAFAWGFNPSLATSVPQTVAGEVNAMFTDNEKMDEICDWKQVKQHYLAVLSTNETSELSATLENLAEQHPIADFDREMLTFMAKLAESTSLPVLVQLEDGKLDGLSRQETEAFLSRCGHFVGCVFGTK